MGLLVLAALLLAVVGGARLQVGPAVRVRALAARWWPVARAYVAGSPGTFLYLFVVSVTAWVLATSGPEVDQALLRSHSSNLAALAQSPMAGLVQSAFWVEGLGMFILAWVLGVLLAPVERWLGTPRWIAVFALGHIVTTLVVALVLWGAVRTGHAEPGARHMIDVGVSYGFGAVAGVLTHRFSHSAGRAYAAAVGGVLLVLLVAIPDFTSLGHLVAFLIGLACVPLARERGGRVVVQATPGVDSARRAA